MITELTNEGVSDELVPVLREDQSPSLFTYAIRSLNSLIVEPELPSRAANVACASVELRNDA
jgi:hypothetical protein